KPIKLNVEYGGVITDPWGKTRNGLTIEGKINRKEFGLEWNSSTETGGLVLSDEVKLHANAEFVKQG
ncbi:MAG TPA: YceI family protein, partial [Puia sp.]